MAKGKSSATSATRKKHARKAAGHLDEPAVPKEKKPKGKDKKNVEPRKKVYIPPVKPAPAQPDPLDTLGLAQRLPPELLVVLRRLPKKDATTKRRALEEFQSAWVDRGRFEGSDSTIVHALVDAIPVWLHHVPPLFLHPSRRIRLLAAGVHSSLLRLPGSVRDQLLFFIREVASMDQAQYILGSWCMAAHDVDRQVSALARDCWNDAVSLSKASGKKLVLNESLLASLWEFIQNTLLDPMAIYLYVNPPQSVTPASAPHKKGGRPVPRSIPPRQDEDASIRSKSEEDEENVQDRMARLRVGAFGSAEWVLNGHFDMEDGIIPEELLAPFSNPVLWSALYHLQTPPFVQVQSAGYGQPNVRKAAWSLLQTLLRTCRGHLKTQLPVLSSAVLRSAWIEPDQNVRGSMWQPLLTFLKEFPNAWEIAATSEKEEEADESGSDDSEDETLSPAQKAPAVPALGPSKAYREFLQFLELGCAGMPLQGYPTVLVILSTIPSSILASTSSLSPLEDLFASFWAAIDGRALSSLDRTTTSAAFLSSLLESLIFFVRRLMSSAPEDAALLAMGSPDADPSACTEVAKKLAREQFAKAWRELSAGHLKVENATAASLLARTLLSLNRLDTELFRAAWDVLSSGVKEQFKYNNTVISPLISVLLKVFLKQFQQGSLLEGATRVLTGDVLQAAVRQCDQMLNSIDAPSAERISSLVNVLDTFGERLFDDPELAAGIDETIQRHAYQLISFAPSLLLVYLSHRKDDALCSALWHRALLEIASHPDTAVTTLPPLLDAAERGFLPQYLKHEVNELDDLAGRLLTVAVTGTMGNPELALIQKLLRVSDFFFSASCTQGLVESICHAFAHHFHTTLYDESVALDSFDTLLELVRVLVENQSLPLPAKVSVALMPDIFLFAFLLPQFLQVEAEQLLLTRSLWEAWLAQVTEGVQENARAVIRRRLRELLVDCSARPAPEDILQMLVQDCPGLAVDVVHDVFPSRDDVDVMLDALPSMPADPSLAAMDPLVPPSSQYEYEWSHTEAFDHAGYSEYSRIINGLLLHLIQDRQAARENMWALRHFLALSLYADDFVKVPFAQSPVFKPHLPKTVLQELQSRVQQVTTYLLSSSQEEGWHASAVNEVLSGSAISHTDEVGRLIGDLIEHAKHDDTVRESRILYMILQHVLNNSSKGEANLWMSLCRKLEKSAPQTSLAIALAVTRFAPEPPLLDRYRNELAAAVLGVRPSKANTDGLWLLRRLNVTAPDPESDVVFLSQPRAVNFMKACQQWITSDEDLDEEVQGEMTSTFFHLVPILQNMPGAHWDLIFDVLENNLENSSFTEPSTLVTLSRSLRLFIAIQDLVSTNKALRAVWEDRRTTCLTLVRDLVATKLDADRSSFPLSICRELALQIVQDLPTSLIDETTLPKFCHIITDASIDVQRMGHRLLHEAARKYTEHLVIEAAVDSETTLRPELPLELVHILQRNLNYEDPVEHDDQQLSGYLLAWMIVFDLFTNASLKVRSGYIDHLRDQSLVSLYFLPSILNILGLYGGILRAFKLDVWAVDEYYLDSYSTDSPLSLRLLAAHLYYRALLVVPSLIRDWLRECKDRQLFNTVTAYTSNYFSPIIVRAELSEVKDPDATADLVDENFTLKTASVVSEVTAAYIVDEYQLEITVKLPSDYPLHGIEIKDTKRLGVAEERWRAWVLGVQQILSFRGGRIVDGFSFFKKNVSSHFEGIPECAICYSIISATDGSLPRKPCRTCKNRFHAGCLFQWFNTSHSSSCPLCRSEVM
ncbi:hypothetical protein SCP_1500820 [Sparassis crispa]|uniref:E3 ubiquitin-protein ligase listerin n=1 Tax=Sparassis crispa TaxID=139825 RepID=A0A401H3W7_9APHY|nr:hypothetical protein SCP_1500820 [Sparassis crispa]GBE89079.1 hypothetical protein SCP_1500820 [Sparassis crispa]